MNIIYQYMVEQRNGSYCHALEVYNAYELESIIEQFIDQNNERFTTQNFIDYFKTMEVIVLETNEVDQDENDLNEAEVYSFLQHDLENFITSCLE
ncbi:MAG: hypothetical protein RR959_06110 [Erysipelotrichaceae bacterium]